jgi:hypothetical protein
MIYLKTFEDNTAYLVNASSEDEARTMIDCVGDPTDYPNSKNTMVELENIPWMIEVLPKQTLSEDEWLPAALAVPPTEEDMRHD